MINLVLIGAVRMGTSQTLVRAAIRRGMQVNIITSLTDDLTRVFPDAAKIVPLEYNAAAVTEWIRRNLLDKGKPVVVTTANNRYAQIAAQVASFLGLPGPEPYAIAGCISKAQQKELLHSAGVGTPKSIQWSVRLGDNLERSLAELSFPVVVKPEEGSESFGVRLCTNIQEVSHHIDSLRRELEQKPRTGISQDVLIEEYLEGPEYFADFFDGKCIAILRKLKQHGATFIERGFTSDLNLPQHLFQQLAETCTRALAVAGLNWGPVHLDCIVYRDHPHVLEINPRIAGSFICDVIRDAYGFDLVESLLGKLMGEQIYIPNLSFPTGYARVDFQLSTDPEEWTFKQAGNFENDQIAVAFGPHRVDLRDRRSFIYVATKPMKKADAAILPTGTKKFCEPVEPQAEVVASSSESGVDRAAS